MGFMTQCAFLAYSLVVFLPQGADAARTKIAETLEASMPLPGGYVVGDEVYFVDKSHTFGNGLRLIHGNKGRVEGGAKRWTYMAPPFGLSVQFPENPGPVDLWLTQISREAPTEAPPSTSAPTEGPLPDAPTEAPAPEAPVPTEAPTDAPAPEAPAAPTKAPSTGAPTDAPTDAPTEAPAAETVTDAPTDAPPTDAPAQEEEEEEPPSAESSTKAPAKDMEETTTNAPEQEETQTPVETSKPPAEENAPTKKPKDETPTKEATPENSSAWRQGRGISATLMTLIVATTLIL